MLSTENNNKDMMKMIDMTKKKRVVVKVGTSTLTHSTGLLNIRRVEQLVKTLADLQNAGHEIILVSSGAVGLGRAKLGIKERPKDTPTRQGADRQRVSRQGTDVLAGAQKRHAHLPAGRSAEDRLRQLPLCGDHAPSAAAFRRAAGGIRAAVPPL